MGKNRDFRGHKFSTSFQILITSNLFMIKRHISNMNRQHPCPHFSLQIIQILAIFSEIWIHCQYLLTDPRMLLATETDSVLCQDVIRVMLNVKIKVRVKYTRIKDSMLRMQDLFCLC